MDAAILEQVLGSIHNWFVRDSYSVRECAVTDGSLPASVPVPNGIWYRIQGSYLNDGMHLKGDEDEGLVDETFDGTITVHVIPKALLSVVDDISAWQAKYGDTADSPYQSESFGGYSYTKKSGSSSSGGGSNGGWQSVFNSRLRQWRKLS